MIIMNESDGLPARNLPLYYKVLKMTLKQMLKISDDCLEMLLRSYQHSAPSIDQAVVNRTQVTLSVLRRVASTLCLMVLVSSASLAERPQRGYRSIDEVMQGTPKLGDQFEVDELIELSNDKIIHDSQKEYRKKWQAIGCQVEGFGPMDRTICPRYIVEASGGEGKQQYDIKTDGSVQFMTLDQWKAPELKMLPSYEKRARERKERKERKAKSDLEGKI